MKVRLLLNFALALGFTFGAIAQDRTVSGTVSTVEDGGSLPGVSVYIQGTTTGVVTGADGTYRLSVPSGSSLVFSFVGYKEQVVQVGSRSTIDVSMELDVTELSEVIVTALGVEKETKALGYAATNVGGDEVIKSQETNVLNALNGKVAGVNIQSGNTVAGGTTRITIRGNSSLVNGKNQPLIIVDGVPIENNIAGTGAQSFANRDAGSDWGSGINDINAFDIADMTVLKGPNAAALYGARGANGVILITTKKGKKKEGIGLDFNYSNLVIQPWIYRTVQNKYGGGTAGYNQNVIQRGQVNGNDPDGNGFQTDADDGTNLMPSTSFWGSGASWGPEMTGQQVKWWNGEIYDYSPNPNNVQDFFNNGSIENYNVSFSGASEVGSFRASLTRNNTVATTPNTDRNQNTVNLNASINITSKVRADASISYFNSFALNSPTLGNSENSIGKNLTWNWARDYKPDLEFGSADNPTPWQLADGTRAPAGSGRQGIDRNAGFPGWGYRGLGRTSDFAWRTWNRNQTRERDRLLGSLSLNYEITDWLNLMTRIGIDTYGEEYESKFKPIDQNGIQVGRYSHTLADNEIQNHTWMLTANKEVSQDFSFTAVVGGETWGREFYSIQGDNAGRNFVFPNLYTFSNIQYPVDANGRVSSNWVRNQALPREAKFEKQINSLFGSVDLNYKNIAFLQITGRNDWSSTLPIDANSYFYPSANASFVFTDAFDMNSNILSFGKVRFGVSQTATDTNPYQLDPTFSSGSYRGQPSAAVSSLIPPTALRNETSNAIEAGLDLRFFNGRAQLDVAVYDIRMSDQILQGPVARSSGFTAKRFNQGEIQNKGFELLLTGTPVETSDLSWDVTFNMNANRNWIISLDDEGDVERIVFGGIFGFHGPSIEARPGEEYGTITVWDYVYFDKNGNGETDDAERVPENRVIADDGTWYDITPDREPVGNATPTWIGGLTNTLRWKNFTLNVHMDIRQGGDIFSGSLGVGTSMGQAPSSLFGRNASEGGQNWTETITVDGVEQTVNRDDGIVKQGVYSDGTTNDKVVPFFYEHLDQFTWGAGSGAVTALTFEASWIRLRELSVTYDFPSSMLSSIGFIQNASLSLIGRNLWYLRNTAPDGMDPSGTNGAGTVQGIEWGQMPGTRNLGFSLRASF